MCMNVRTIGIPVLGLTMGLLFSIPVHAQVVGATVTGTITDAQGGTIPNAAVSAKNVATNVSFTTTTNTAGEYTLPNLNPGDYEVSVSSTGFGTAVSNINLTVGAKQEMNISLTI